MENLAVMDFYQSSFEHFERLLETRPQAIVCDLHPDFMTSHFARELSQKKYSRPCPAASCGPCGSGHGRVRNV